MNKYLSVTNGLERCEKAEVQDLKQSALQKVQGWPIVISQCHRLSRYNNACTTSNQSLRIYFPFHSFIYVHCQPTITRSPIIDHSEGHPTVHPLLQHCCIGALYAPSPIATALLHWCSLCTVTHCYSTGALVLSMHRHTQVHS